MSGRWVSRGRALVFYLAARSPHQWLRLFGVLRSRRYDVLHVNGVFAPLTGAFLVAARLRLIRCRLLLVSPHGECAPGALAIRARKKRWYLRFLRALLRGADTRWHASTAFEAAHIAAVFPGARVVTHHLPVDLPARARPPACAPADVTRTVFLSRIAPKKNLGTALRALRFATGPLHLDVYGPVEDPAYWARCAALIDALPAHVTVRHRGEVPPGAAIDVFSRYDAFVFPTRGENFGYVIAESLAASCPVICSAETPWTSVLDAGGGTVVGESSPRAWADVLNAFAALSPGERAVARARAGEAYDAWRAERTDGNLFAGAWARQPSGRVRVGPGRGVPGGRR
ncbi:glycosyltransferase [Luedemannella flava]